MNALEICGILFLIEVAFIIITMACTTAKGIVERKQKKKTYKEMIKVEKELSKTNKESCDPEEKDKELIDKIKNDPETLNKVLENAISK